MASTLITLRNPLGSVVFQETALTITPVAMALSDQKYYHFELDNTANSAVTYFKFFLGNTAPTLASDTPRVIIPVQPSTKAYMTVPSGLLQITGMFVIATSTLENATGGAPTAPTTAVALTVLG